MTTPYVATAIARKSVPWWESAAPVAIGCIAGALRLLPTLIDPGLNHPDELFQSLEQAHRIVFGYGEVPWEFLTGARSWLLPGALAAFMWIGDQIKDSPAYYLGAVHVALAALAATSAVCAFLWGRRSFGLAGGIAAAMVPTLWPELIYFGGRSLSESVAAPIFVLALYLLDTITDENRTRRGFIVGALFGLSLVLRLQLAPALAIVFLWRGLERWRGRASMAAERWLLRGFVTIVGLAGLLDFVTWGSPFHSLVYYIIYNTIYGVASGFGVEPWSYYFVATFENWGWSFVPLVILAAIGARRLPMVFAAAVAIFVAHCFVAHKEYRFIYPALLLFMVVAGIGLAELVTRLSSRLRLPQWTGGLIALCLPGMLAIGSAASASTQSLWGSGHDVLRAASYVARLEDVCGVGSYDANLGYTYFHHKVPYYADVSPEELARDLPGFNVFLTTQSIPANYKTLECFGKTCVAKRPGSCAPLPPQPIFPHNGLHANAADRAAATDTRD